MRDTDHLAKRLRAHLANGPSVTGVSVLSAGHSNETYLVHGIDKVLRMGPVGSPLLPLALSVRQQFDLLAVLRGRAGAPPTPGLDYACDDPGVLGSPFYLMDRVDGIPWADWRTPEWADDASPAFREGISRQALDVLVSLHTAPPLNAYGPVLDNAGEVRRWRDHARDVQLPRLAELFDRVEACAPPSQAPSACHGDPKLANMLWKDGRLVAVLDWEMGFNGDPRWDLVYYVGVWGGEGRIAQPGYEMPGYWQRDEVISRWEAATGRTASDLDWFDAANSAKVSAIVGYGWHLFTTGMNTDERFAPWDAVANDYIAQGHALLDGYLAKRGQRG